MREPMDSLVEYVNAPARTAAGASRLVPLDALRGVIIAVLALEHANCLSAHEPPTS